MFSCARMLLLGVLAQPAAAQVLGIDSAQEAPSAQLQQPEDPLGRSTPRDAIASFIRAVERDDFVSEARYLQVTEAQRRNTDDLARDLKALMDRYFSQALTTVSDSPSGAMNDGLSLDRERVGPLTIGDRKIDVELRRVTDPQAGFIGLISSDTLAFVPGLHDALAQSWIEQTMPQSLVNREVFGISMAHWLIFAASLLVPFILLALLAGICILLARRIISNPARERELNTWYAGIRWPAIAALTLTIQLMSIPALGLPLTFRIAYARVGLLLFVIALAWFVRRLLTLAFSRARAMTRGRDAASTRSLMLLGERLFKAFVVVVAFVAILLLLGVESKTALAAFGIVGVALALGAQRTVENLLGGVFMLSDRAIAIGDLCSISNRLGWIEDITLRSVRLRTLDNSLVSVPSGVLAQEGIESFRYAREDFGAEHSAATTWNERRTDHWATRRRCGNRLPNLHVPRGVEDVARSCHGCRHRDGRGRPRRRRAARSESRGRGRNGAGIQDRSQGVPQVQLLGGVARRGGARAPAEG